MFSHVSTLLVLGARLAAASLAGPAPHFNDIGTATKHFAAFSVLEPSSNSSLRTVLGPVRRERGPVMPCDLPWEHDVNNGYSSILYDPEDSLKLGVYRLYYSASDPGFDAPQGCPPSECGSGDATLYATSKDGLHWEKPFLGRIPWHNSTQNNIIFTSTSAVAVYDDSWNAHNLSARFKVWGNLPAIAEPVEGDGHTGYGSNLGYKPEPGGVAVSADGLNFVDYRRIQNMTDKRPNTYRFDAQASMFYDPSIERYVGTNRAFRPCKDCGKCPIWWQPHGGCQGHKGPDCTPEQCNRTVRAIGTVTTDGPDFSTAIWGPNVEVLKNPSPTTQLYSQVTFPFYNVYLGIVMAFDAVDPPNVYGKGKVRCELAWSADGKTFQRMHPGQSFIPPGSIENRDFDSHICFAAAHPVKTASQVQLFYMGGDGPHYSPAWPDPLHRNSSLGLATLRPDGFVGLQAVDGIVGKSATIPLNVTAPQLLLTADTAPGGTVTINVVSDQSQVALACDPLHGENVTDQALGGCDLTHLVGHSATLVLELQGSATVYTFGFGPSMFRFV